MFNDWTPSKAAWAALRIGFAAFVIFYSLRSLGWVSGRDGWWADERLEPLVTIIGLLLGWQLRRQVLSGKRKHKSHDGALWSQAGMSVTPQFILVSKERLNSLQAPTLEIPVHDAEIVIRETRKVSQKAPYAELLPRNEKFGRELSVIQGGQRHVIDTDGLTPSEFDRIVEALKNAVAEVQGNRQPFRASS